MSHIPPALSAHLAHEVTSVCHCWRLTRRDGVVMGFTDHDRALTIDGLTCKPQSGFSASEARHSLGMAVDSVDIEGALSSVEIDEADVEAGKYDGASVEAFLVNWRAPDEFALLRKLSIARITRQDGRFLAELESAMSALDRPNGRTISRRCDAQFGDARCGISLISPVYRATGAVLRVVAGDTIAASGLAAFAGRWFEHGRITWTSGANAGLSDVIQHDRQVGSERLLTLRRDNGPPPQTGDAFTIFAGCDKAFSTCKAKFANAVNFRGFPHLPGNDAAYNYAVKSGKHDGKPIVP